MILKELIEVMTEQMRVSIRVMENMDTVDEDVITVYTGTIKSIPWKILKTYAKYKVLDVASPAEDFGYINEDATEMSFDCDGSVKPSIDEMGRIIFTFNNCIAIYIEK